MCTYIYVYIRICACMYIRIYVYISTFTYIYIFIYMLLSIGTRPGGALQGGQSADCGQAERGRERGREREREPGCERERESERTRQGERERERNTKCVCVRERGLITTRSKMSKELRSSHVETCIPCKDKNQTACATGMHASVMEAGLTRVWVCGLEVHLSSLITLHP